MQAHEQSRAQEQQVQAWERFDRLDQLQAHGQSVQAHEQSVQAHEQALTLSGLKLFLRRLAA